MRGFGVNVFFLFLQFFFCCVAFGGNVRLSREVQVLEVGSSAVSLGLSVSWEGSWCDNSNWDAVWLFLKYRTSSHEEWLPVYLSVSGHTLSEGYTWSPGRSGGLLTGIFIQRSVPGSGRSDVDCVLKWDFSGSGLSASDIAGGRVHFLAQGIEMVYIPYGGYYLGDGVSINSFRGVDGRAVAVRDTSSRRVYIKDGVPSYYDLPSSYPSGYSGFYVMKYEVSQEQYVVFFNTLSREEQESLLGRSFLESLHAGDYVFGDDRLRPSHRNFITVSSVSEGLPAVLHNGPLYDTLLLPEDGRTLACNYMSLKDLLGYCSWSGLRPLCETEYEKSCRRPYPSLALEGEYAWNSSSLPVFVESVEQAHTLAEYPSDSSMNANYVSSLLGGDTGPLRCGSPGVGAGGSGESGGSFWSVMELSGNVGELCRNVSGASSFRSDVHGRGEFDLFLFDTSGTCYGYRGGGFDSHRDRLRISDRKDVHGVGGWDVRRASSGFRAVHRFEPGVALHLNGGVIEVEGGSDICPGSAVRFVSRRGAFVEGGVDVPFSYRWYVDGEEVAGASDSTLVYRGFSQMGHRYVAGREAWCAYGSVFATTEVTVLRPLVSAGLVGAGKEEVCPEEELEIGNVISAFVDCGLSVGYRWHLNDTLAGSAIAGAEDSSLVYTSFSPGQRYRFLREASCLTGHAFTSAVDVYCRVPGIDSGEIALSHPPVCPLDVVTVENVREASDDCGVGIAYYSWALESSRETVLFPEERSLSLTYRSGFRPGERYRFRREAVSRYGSSSAYSSWFTVPSVSVEGGTIVAGRSEVCAGDEVWIKSVSPGGVSSCSVEWEYVWEMDGKLLAGEKGEELLQRNVRNGSACIFRRGVATVYDTVWSNTVEVVPVDPELNAGSIRVADGVTRACLGDSVEIVSTENASLICGRVVYRWRIDDEVIPGASGPSLKYKVTNASRSYLFIRDASYDGGLTWPVSARLPEALQGATKTDFSVSPASGTISECEPVLSLEVTDGWGKADINWHYESGGRVYLNAGGYTCSVNRGQVNVGNGVGTNGSPRYVVVTYERDGCKSVKQIPVMVEPWTVMQCVSTQETYFTDCRDGKRYRMKKMADGKCWMVFNLAFDCTYKTSTGTLKYDSKRVSDKCSGVSGFDYSGGNYYGRDAMLGTKCGAICPEGWHVPSNWEYQQLAGAYGGMSVAGKALKSPERWKFAPPKDGVSFEGDNRSGFRGLPFGTYGTTNSTIYAYWWTSDKSKFSLVYNKQEAKIDGGSTYYNIRCVRDLRPDEK